MYRIAITNRHLCDGDYSKQIEKICQSSLFSAIVLREKDLDEAEYERLAKEVIAICNQYDIPCILHSFHEVVMRLRHPFLQLPLPVWKSLSEEKKIEIRKCCDRLGSSVHSVDEMRTANELGLDYVMAGHIFQTDCKKDLAPRGLEFLHNILEVSEMQVYGLGGIHFDNEQSVLDAGADGVCLMSEAMKL